MRHNEAADYKEYVNAGVAEARDRTKEVTSAAQSLIVRIRVEEKDHRRCDGPKQLDIVEHRDRAYRTCDSRSAPPVKVDWDKSGRRIASRKMQGKPAIHVFPNFFNRNPHVTFLKRRNGPARPDSGYE